MEKDPLEKYLCVFSTNFVLNRVPCREPVLVSALLCIAFCPFYFCNHLGKAEGAGCFALIGPRREKTCLRRFANNKGADQPAHLRSLVSVFVIRLLESIISRLATSEISIFYLVSIAEQAGLNPIKVSKRDWQETS